MDKVILLSHLQQEVGCRLLTIFGKENKWQGYLLLQNNGDLHNTLYCALMDKKTESSNKIIHRQNTPIEKSELDAASEGAIPNNFNTVINAQAHLWAKSEIIKGICNCEPGGGYTGLKS